MSIEQKIDDLIAALNANTAAHSGKAATAPAAADKPAKSTGAKGAKAKPEAAKPETDYETVKERVFLLRDSDGGVPHVKSIQKELGIGAFAEVEGKPEVWDELLAKVNEKIEELGIEEESGGI